MMGKLLGVYVFGSIARGDRDDRSDLDLLAVVTDGHGKVSENEVLNLIPETFLDLEPSISWYGRNRLKQMFRNGELFAWHLHAESIPLMERESVIASIGQPAPYKGALEDVVSFKNILSEIPDQIAIAPENAMYELGLMYVCLRNICMAASSVLCGRPDFSRYSPFNLNRFMPVPISRTKYDLAMACRMAGQRGFDPPSGISPDCVGEIHLTLLPWLSALELRLEAEA